MEEDDCAFQYFSADVDNIDCPNWINFEEECYEDRFDHGSITIII